MFDGSSPTTRHRLRGPNRGIYGAGMYKAPRSALQPGAVTRREWLRFLSYVTLGDLCDCTTGVSHVHWLYTGFLDKKGYGRIGWRGRNYSPHRFACIALGRPVPIGYDPDHLCRLPPCCNPACIEVVTKQENIKRGDGICAKHARKTHCIHGHLLSSDNLYPPRLAQGDRVCITCMKVNQARQDAKRKAAMAALSPRPPRTHCKQGHPLSGENLQPYELHVLGQRVCRLCVRAREHRYRASKGELAC